MYIFYIPVIQSNYWGIYINNPTLSKVINIAASVSCGEQSTSRFTSERFGWRKEEVSH